MIEIDCSQIEVPVVAEVTPTGTHGMAKSLPHIRVPRNTVLGPMIRERECITRPIVDPQHVARHPVITDVDVDIEITVKIAGHNAICLPSVRLPNRREFCPLLISIHPRRTPEITAIGVDIAVTVPVTQAITHVLRIVVGYGVGLLDKTRPLEVAIETAAGVEVDPTIVFDVLLQYALDAINPRKLSVGVIAPNLATNREVGSTVVVRVGPANASSTFPIVQTILRRLLDEGRLTFGIFFRISGNHPVQHDRETNEDDLSRELICLHLRFFLLLPYAHCCDFF